MPQFLVRGLRPGTEVRLPPAEARHAVRSLRLGPGDLVLLFDGAGTVCQGEIVSVRGGSVTVRVDRALPSGPVRRVVIASAVPKGRRLAWMVAKLTELGVAAFVPVAFRRSVVRWTPARAQRMARIAAESAKQCGRSELMALEPEATVAELGVRPGREGPTFVAVPGADRTLLRAIEGSPPAVRVVIGPEGGFAPDEIERIEGLPVSLGPATLRIETAAVVAAAVLAQR